MARTTRKYDSVFALFLILGLFFAVPGGLVRAEQTPAEIQKQLEEELRQVEREIETYQKQLSETSSKKKTLASAIAQLKTRQAQLNAQLKQTAIQINALKNNITIAEKDIEVATAKETLLKEQIGAMLRRIQQEETRPLLVLASSDSLSSAFSEIQQYAEMGMNLHALAEEVRDLRKKTSEKKAALEDQKADAQELLHVKTMQTKELTGTIHEQNTLLSETKGLEANYQSALADRKKRAAQIRNRIYELFNTGGSVTFGQAVDIAEMASRATGVRAAYLLAILTQESNLGKNVGTCNRAGDPEEKSWRVIMKPERDHQPFLEITESLGMNPDTTPVSCPMRGKNGKQIGWGGAMGPAQFIPSTWVGYKDRVAAMTGKGVANPWDIRDAFFAAAIKLRDAGAGNVDGEWKAAMIYFAGSVKMQFRFYGDNVVALANKYQTDIDDLK